MMPRRKFAGFWAGSLSVGEAISRRFCHGLLQRTFFGAAVTKCRLAPITGLSGYFRQRI
jgi:hypothetical protein